MWKMQHFQKPIVDVIKTRTSVRTYEPIPIPQEMKKQLIEYGETIRGPLDKSVRFLWLDQGDLIENSKGKIGTYGVIKGASSFIAIIGEKNEQGLIEVGYSFEKLVLFAASLGLGTCWLGGTFTRETFRGAANLKESELLPIVSPIGYPVEKKRVLDKTMRFLAGSDHRKPVQELFFYQNWDTPLTEEEAGVYKMVFKMVQQAPSASNLQPWRIVKDGPQFHFYLKQNRKYAMGLGFNIQKIDMGIAMCHFEMTAKELGLLGAWSFPEKNPPISPKEDHIYIGTWNTEVHR